MRRFLSLVPYLLVAVGAGVVIALLFPQVSPLGGVRLSLSPNEISQTSADILNHFTTDVQGMTSQAVLQSNQGLVRHLSEDFGVAETNRLFREGVPGFFWRVTWRNPEDLEKLGRRSSEEAARDVLSALMGEIVVRLDPSGHLLGFERRIPDTLAISSIGEDSSRSIAQGALDQLLLPGAERLDWAHRLQFLSATFRDQPGHRQSIYLWSGSSKQLAMQTEIEVTIAGSLLQKIDVRYVVPEVRLSEGREDIRTVIVIAVYVICVIALVISGIRLIRAYELGFRLAAVVGVVVALAIGYQIFLEMRALGADQVIALLLSPVLVGGTAVLVWAVAESVVRESSREKLTSLDLVTRGHAFHSLVGKSAAQGIALGLAAYATFLFGLWLMGMFGVVTLSASVERVAEAFPAQTPLLTVLAGMTLRSTFIFAIVILFGVSWLRARLPIPILAVVIPAAFLGLENFAKIEPVWPAMAIQALTNGLIVWAFYRNDVLAAFLAMLTYLMVPAVTGMALSGNGHYELPAVVAIAATVAVILGGMGLQFRRRELSSFDDITPAFARNITERQRLQQELEIARRVQMSFLPKVNPTIEGLDIAAQCIPAQEVGGDYFDFIPLGEGRLGIAIGDVSGKGTQAAFYMTLAKGFLKALSPHHSSPADVLADLNKLFYENVERGAFISMVYAIVDVPQQTVRIARAGHNPVIMRRSEAVDVEVLQPPGLGLGLEAGETFAKMIEEKNVRLRRGDLLVFYTDGFSEAMNKDLKEFGEQNLYQVVNAASGGSAQEILQEIFASVKKFAGKQKQHDDMTMVVLKVT